MLACLLLLAPAVQVTTIPDSTQVNVPGPLLADVDGDRLVLVERDVLAPAVASVRVWERVAGSWGLNAIVTPAVTLSGVESATTAALSGDTLVVRVASFPSIFSNTPVDAHVLVYVKEASGWVQQATLDPVGADPTADAYGASLAIDGDIAVVGASLDNHSGAGFAGSAYVFVRNGTTWSQEQKLIASQPGEFAFFGGDMAISGDTLAVGASGDPSPANNTGAVYVFRRSGTQWSEEARLQPAGAWNGFNVGSSVDLDGDVCAIGATMSTTSFIGRAYAFHRTGTTWTQEATLIGYDNTFWDLAGAVAVGGETIVVGAWLHDQIGADSGTAYVFTRDAGDWSEVAELRPFDLQADDGFGRVVHLSGDRALVVSDPGISEFNLAPDAHTYTDPIDFCAGDGGDQAGCTDCPCGANAPVGTVSGCAHAASGFFAGRGARLFADVSPAPFSRLEFRLEDAPPGGFAILVSGPSAAPSGVGANPCPVGSGLAQPATVDGLRCITSFGTGGIVRHGVRQVDAAGAIDANGVPPEEVWQDRNAGVANWGVPAGAGLTRHFQAFVRQNPGAGCGTGLTTTQGVTVSYLP